MFYSYNLNEGTEGQIHACLITEYESKYEQIVGHNKSYIKVIVEKKEINNYIMKNELECDYE